MPTVLGQGSCIFGITILVFRFSIFSRMGFWDVCQLSYVFYGYVIPVLGIMCLEYIHDPREGGNYPVYLLKCVQI